MEIWRMLPLCRRESHQSLGRDGMDRGTWESDGDGEQPRMENVKMMDKLLSFGEFLGSIGEKDAQIIEQIEIYGTIWKLCSVLNTEASWGFGNSPVPPSAHLERLP